MSRAASAVEIMLTAFSTFLLAALMPRSCARIFSEITSPAGSSAARLMRSPAESFSMDEVRLRSVLFRLRQAFRAVMLLLMLRDMAFLLGVGRFLRGTRVTNGPPRSPPRRRAEGGLLTRRDGKSRARQTPGWKS